MDLPTSPAIRCKEPLFDFGRRSPYGSDGSVKHEFMIENIGTSPLEITNVRPSVGCNCGATIKIPERIVKPGSNAVISIEWFVLLQRGTVKRQWYVESNDPNEPRFLLTMVGSVNQDVEIRPAVVDFGEIQSDSVVERAVEITCATNVLFQITNLTTFSTNFAVTSQRMDPLHHRLTIRTVPPFKRGVSIANISVFTDNQEYKEIKVLIVANVPNKLIVVPESISLNSSAPQTTSWHLAIGSRDKSPFNIISLHVVDSNIRGSYYPMGADGYRVTLTNLFPSSDLEGRNLVIETDLPEAKEVVIPIHVR